MQVATLPFGETLSCESKVHLFCSMASNTKYRVITLVRDAGKFRVLVIECHTFPVFASMTMDAYLASEASVPGRLLLERPANPTEGQDDKPGPVAR